MIKNEIVKAYDEYKEKIKRFQDPIQEQDPAVVILITPKALAELMCERKYDIRIDGKANCYFTSMFGKRTPIAIRWDLPGNVKFVIQGQSEYERQEKEKLLDKFKRMFEDGGRRMKLYERIENNNFDEIDRNRAIELIEGGNGHLVYNENYFKLQKENEELKED